MSESSEALSSQAAPSAEVASGSIHSPLHSPRANRLPSSRSRVPSRWPRRIARTLAHPFIAGLLLGAIITLATWSASLIQPTPGLDYSWAAGLAMAFVHHLQFGRNIVFTYGPLGFLTNPILFYGITSSLALLYGVLIRWVLATSLFMLLRYRYSVIISFALTWAVTGIATSLVDVGDLALGAGLCLALLANRATTRRSRLLTVALLAALAGLQCLVKVSDGAILTAIAGLLAVSSMHRAWRDILVAAVPFAATFLIAWFATAQSLSNLISYIRGSLSITLGYSSAMGISAGRGLENGYAVVVFLLLLGGTIIDLRGRPRRECWSLGLILAVWSWAVYKEGFVRHDAHDLVFFGLALIPLVSIRAPRSLQLHHIVSIALAATMAMSAAGGVPYNLLAPARAQSLVRQATDVFSASRRTALIRSDRSRLQRSGPDALPSKILTQLVGHTVAIEPWENLVAWIYPSLRWDPEPVLQAYSAYTPYLDHLDSNFLRSLAAPQRILLSIASIDGRDPFFGPPATEIELLCRYVQIATAGGWQVLAKVPNRCGTPIESGHAHAAFGKAIPVPSPSPNSLVVARISLHPTVLGTIEGIILKQPPFFLTATTGAGTSTYRFISGTASDLHVLATPSTLGYSPPFTPPTLTALRFSGGGWHYGQGRVAVTFYTIPMH